MSELDLWEYEFEAEIKAGDGGGAFVEFPYDVQEEFGTRGRVPVAVSFDGEPYRGSLARMGHGCHFVVILKEIRARIGKQPGDRVTVVLRKDLEERVVGLPPELRARLEGDAKAKAFYESLSYSCKKEYAGHVAGAKKVETRKGRADKVLGMLREGRKRLE